MPRVARLASVRRLLKMLVAHRARLARTASAVALAVSLVVGTVALTDTIDSAFRRAADSAPGVDVVVRATSKFTAQAVGLPERETVPESLVDTVRRVPGVKSVWGAVSGYAELVDKQGEAISARGLPTVGTSWSPDATIVAGRPPSGPGEIAIDDATARKDGYRIGDRIKVLLEGAVQEFTIAGLRKVNHLLASTQASFDLATAQRLLGEEGVLDAIPVQGDRGITAEALRERISAVLPDRYEVITYEQAARETEESWTDALGFLTTALIMLAAVALLVGAFMIHNTFSVLVAQRSRELGLMRAVGASRRQVIGAVIGEAVAVGLVASLLGLLAGMATARVLLALLGDSGFDLPAAAVVLSPKAVALGVLCGMAVTVVAAVAPAVRATRLSPLAALGGLTAEETGSPRRRTGWGVAVVATGAAALAWAVAGDPGQPAIPMVAGVAGVLAGVAMLAPVIARPAARFLGITAHLAGHPGILGRDNAMRNPRRTAATAAALMIGIALIGVGAVMAASMKASATEAVGDAMRADFAVTGKGLAMGGGGVPPLVAEKLRQTREVEMVSEVRGGQWGLDGRARTLVAIEPETISRMYDLDSASRDAVAQLDDSSVLVRDSVARAHRWEPGDRLPMTFAKTGTREFRVAATFTSTLVRSDYVISLKAFKANYVPQLDLEVDVLLKPGVTPVEGRTAVEEALADFPNVDVRNPAEVAASLRHKIDGVLLPVTAVLALSVLIGLLGIVNTLALSVHERTRELGVLRAVGMGRHQLRTMVCAEAVIVAGLGAALGVALAVVLGGAIVAGLGDLGLNRLVVPAGQLGALGAAATLAGLLAAVIPSRRAARVDVLHAVSFE